ncbi:MAG TPA: TonB-dependent siderophore receptor [Usitatibacter sp.]|nr:TonB-dependent siderophore receptor [Usitatibacter sp.]
MNKIAGITLFCLLSLCTAIAGASERDEARSIASVLDGQFGRPGSPVVTGPIVVEGDHAVAGWTQGEMGGRALLRRQDGRWTVVACGGNAFREAANLEQAGVPTTSAQRIAERLAVEEGSLPAARLEMLGRFGPAIAHAGDDGARAATPMPPVVVTETPLKYSAPATTTGTKSDTPVLLTPQSIQVVPRAVLNDQKVLTLTDAIRNVAGTGSDFGFNGSAQPLLMLRGFQTESMTAQGSMSGMSTYYLDGVKVKGVPVNMANVDSVEVVKGPASVLYGRAEPGGLVNVVPRALSATPSFAVEETVGQYSLSRTLVEAGGALNDSNTLLGRANASYDTSRSNRDFVENRLGAFSGALAWIPKEDTRVAITLDHDAQKYRNDFGIPADGDRPANLPRSRQFNDAPELSRVDSDTVKLDAGTRFSPEWALRVRAVSMRAKTKEVDVWPYRVDLGAGPTPADTCSDTNPLLTLCRYYYYVRPDGRVKLDQGTIDLEGDLTLGGLQHKMLFELERYRTSKTGDLYFAQINSVDVNNPVFGQTPTLAQTMAAPIPTLDFQNWTSFVAQDQVAFGGGWHGVLAVRYDRTEALFTMDTTLPSNRQNFVSPRVGIVWEFAPQQTVYAQYQDAVAANNGRAQDGTELAAERARQIELGWKSTALDGRLSTTVAIYDLVKRNRADYTLFPIVTTTGEARSRGLEIDMMGEVTQQLAIIASYSYLDAVVTEDAQFKGTRLADTARNSASLWGRWMFDEQWAAGAGVFSQGQREGDQGNTFQLPGYARFDAMVSYAFRAGPAKGSVQFNLKNVFDKVYYSGSHQFVKDWIQPGPPRTASLTLRLDY